MVMEMNTPRFLKKTLDKSIFSLSFNIKLVWSTICESKHIVPCIMYNILQIRGLFLNLLNILEKYRIVATWAIVGRHLLLESYNDHNIPAPNSLLYSCNPCNNIRESPLYYGKDIIENIISSKIKHEIGHTFLTLIFQNARVMSQLYESLR